MIVSLAKFYGTLMWLSQGYLAGKQNLYTLILKVLFIYSPFSNSSYKHPYKNSSN